MAIIKVKEIKQNRNKTEDEQTKLMKPKFFFEELNQTKYF